MPAFQWDLDTTRTYEGGVSNVVLGRKDGVEPVAWWGVTNVAAAPSGGESTTTYADNIAYMNLVSAEKAGGSINAYTYPDEWLPCDGKLVQNGAVIGQQTRKPFNLSWLTMVGNDVDGFDHGEIMHFVWDCTASPSSATYATQSDSPAAIEFSWSFTSLSTQTVTIAGKEKKIATLDLDTSRMTPAQKTKYEAFKTAFYSQTTPGFPSAADVLAAMA